MTAYLCKKIEPLARKFEPKLLNKNQSGLGNSLNQKLERDMWLLENTKSKTIDRGWRGSSKYNEQFGPNTEINIKSNFDEISVDYSLREEKRNWIHGIDLRTFLENNGVYPTNDEIIHLIDTMNIDNAKDLGPHNLILNGKQQQLSLSQNMYKEGRVLNMMRALMSIRY